MKRSIAFISLFICSACGSVPSNVSSYASPEFNPQATHVIVARNQAQQDSLEFAEYSLQATRALQCAGIRVDNANPRPDVAVIMDYGMGAPEVSLTTQSTPVTGRIEYKDKDGNLKHGYGTVGYRDVPVSVTNYSKYLTLTAVNFNEMRAGRGRQIWKVDVRTTDDRRDQRIVMPFMLASAIPYIGRSSGYEQYVRVPYNEEKTNYILTGIHNQAPLTSGEGCR